jgi:hypothetical protein
MKKLKLRLKIFNWKSFILAAQREFQETNDPAYLKIIRMANIKLIRSRKELKNLSYKPFYITFERSAREDFRKGDIITEGNHTYIILDPCCKDNWWTNFKAFLGFRPTSIMFTTKVRRYDK